MVIAIREGSEIPIYQQIRDQIVQGISDGRLKLARGGGWDQFDDGKQGVPAPKTAGLYNSRQTEWGKGLQEFCESGAVKF